MLELYIFNKKSPQHEGLTYWNSTSDLRARFTLIYNLDRFKVKSLQEEANFFETQIDSFVDSINKTHKANFENLEKFFHQFSGKSLDIEIVDDFHHIVIYENNVLYLDSRITEKLSLIYLFGIYYSFKRKSQWKEDSLFLELPEFIRAFNGTEIQSLIDLLSNPKSNYDAGGHLREYLIQLTSNSSLDRRLATQLLRNRAIAGKSPYNLSKLTQILDINQSDPFSGKAVEEFYESIRNDFDKGYAKLYYKNLTKSLNSIGLGVIAQRGSRVAHEQGPILANANTFNLNEESLIFLRKTSSSLNEILLKIQSSSKKYLTTKTDKPLEQLNQDIELGISNLDYISRLESTPQARFNKAIKSLKNDFKEYTNTILDTLEESLDREDFLNSYDLIKNLQKDFLSHVIELDDHINNINSSRSKAVIYIQRPSSRSGHFIARILLGQNLYVETDSESEIQRINAIPFNFVCPDLEYVADGIDSFFENASISILTDKLNGQPSIKWENAEDLAISLAPGLYESIKSSNAKGKKFHYQLETTLFGPLIDLFKNLLEHEMSIIATIDHYYGHYTFDNPYENEVLEACDFVFEYYLLEGEVQNYILNESANIKEAKLGITNNLRDVQIDVANYCILKRKNPELLKAIQTQATEILRTDSNSSEQAKAISDLLTAKVSRLETKEFIKKYLQYPESTYRKELLSQNNQINSIIVNSKSTEDTDYSYIFTVAPSRIDFGKNVVASITTLMGRILGADDLESLAQGKEYIDLVSQSENSFFQSSSEAGSVKVIENTCRALQYAKAISFQSSFQRFGIDGSLARLTINARNSKSSGLHVMEYGTMASTGYCITKEPLFILLGLTLSSNEILEKLGINDPQTQQELKSFINELFESREKFKSNFEWELFAYEEISNSQIIQQYLSDPDHKWLPSFNSIITLVKHFADSNGSTEPYIRLTSKLIELGRIINETGIIERVHIMNSAIRRSQINLNINKNHSELKIGLNASYKGNVSDERENANQYIIALLLKQKQLLKNTSIPEVKKLLEDQWDKYPLPQEIRIIDPLVDKDVFMGGELKAIAEKTILKLKEITKLEPDVIEACLISHGSDYKNWKILNKKSRWQNQSDLYKQIDEIKSDLKYLEIYTKGFYKNPLEGFQGLDVIQLNSDHFQIQELMDQLPLVRNLMQINNPNSLLVLIDNPQQAKKPLLDYDRTLEWLALEGTIGSHQISEDKYEHWRREIEDQKNFAKLFIQRLIFIEQLKPEDLASNLEFQKINDELEKYFTNIQNFTDLRRDLLLQKFAEAKEMGISNKIYQRYYEAIKSLEKTKDYNSLEEISFNDWLLFGGRWVLNNSAKEDINYITNLFNKSQQLRHLDKQSYHLLELFVTEYSMPSIEGNERIIERSGSTKEADLLMLSASENLDYRSINNHRIQALIARIEELRRYEIQISSSIDISDLNQIKNHWDYLLNDYLICLNKKPSSVELNIRFARLLKTFEIFSLKLSYIDEELSVRVKEHIQAKDPENYKLNNIFGDHQKHGGLFQKLAQKSIDTSSEELENISKLGEMFIDSYLILLTIEVDDPNILINRLSVFFDQYLNVHEEDYPPYMFHSLCAGASYGFNQTYYLDPNLRSKMFKLACKAGINTYKLLHLIITNSSVLKNSTQEYRDLIIGDYYNGIIPIGYQHETICIEERFWDCMRALRNFVRNYHDKHPLPVIIRNHKAKEIFPTQHKLNWIAGLANIGKHSWDLNCVLRSPLLRNTTHQDPNGEQYINLSVFTPYLTNEGEIKQIYTSLNQEIVETLEYLAPFENKAQVNDLDIIQGKNGFYYPNQEGFIHALISLEKDSDGKLPKPNITMSAHTHPQYINGFTAELGIPETWSLLSMQQMYAKTLVPEILSYTNIDPLGQIEFFYKEFNSIDEVSQALESRSSKYNHINSWILKSSRDSGGRGISGRVNLHSNKNEIVNFIFDKTKTDDVVMQEFVPNNAYSFITQDFIEEVKESFIESGISIKSITPYEHMYFAMRSFQSTSGIKGYLFSANVGSVTVNAGQGAKMFYGEPIYIMPIYIAGKIQKLLDQSGELLLKEAIPKHAEELAKRNHIPIIKNNIGTNNCYMLNGLFDYIPYLYINRKSKDESIRKFKIEARNNSLGGIDYVYNYYGEDILLCHGSSQQESLANIEELLKQSANGDLAEEIDIGLAVIELNSGLGQANLLQKAVESKVPNNRDVFLEWTEDLGIIAQTHSSKRL